MVDDVKRAANCGVKGIVIEIPASAELLEQAYNGLYGKSDRYHQGHLLCERWLYTVFFTIDATRSDINWLLDLVDKVSTQGYMDAFTLHCRYLGDVFAIPARYFTQKVKTEGREPTGDPLSL